MGITADIGQHWLNLADEVCTEHNVDLLDALDWCYPHDNNTVFDLCWMCDDADSQMTDDNFRAIAEQWIADWKEHR
jgi:hypothetical protein